SGNAASTSSRGCPACPDWPAARRPCAGAPWGGWRGRGAGSGGCRASVLLLARGLGPEIGGISPRSIRGFRGAFGQRPFHRAQRIGQTVGGRPGAQRFRLAVVGRPSGEEDHLERRG